MNQPADAHKVITELQEGKFFAECPCCGAPVRLKDAGLFFLDEFMPAAEETYERCLAELKARKKALRELKKQIPETSKRQAQAANIGKQVEHFLPCLPGFRFERHDCRSLFDPIDFMVFEGLSEKGVGQPHRVPRGEDREEPPGRAAAPDQEGGRGRTRRVGHL